MYLLKQTKNNKGAVHHWTGVDTLCRMFSTGGFNGGKPLGKEWIITDDDQGRVFCLMCHNAMNKLLYGKQA